MVVCPACTVPEPVKAQGRGLAPGGVESIAMERIPPDSEPVVVALNGVGIAPGARRQERPFALADASSR
jgi:hypothetical protein